MQRKNGRLSWNPLALLLARFAGLALLALSQTATAQIEEAIRAAHFGATYAAIINFASEPDISSSHLWIDRGAPDELKMGLTKFPLRHEFKLKQHAWKPMVQATLSRFKIEQTSFINATNRVDSEWQSYSATLGGGVRIPLSKHWSILPAIDGGYAHLKNEADYRGDLAMALKPQLSGKLFDWKADAWLVNGHLALFYRNQFGKLGVDAHAGGTAGHIESYDTTDALQKFSETIGTLNLKIDCTYPLGLAIADDPLFVVGHFGNSTILTDLDADLGLSSIYETGFSLLADIARHGLPVKKVGVGAMVLWGQDAMGWALRMTYRF